MAHRKRCAVSKRIRFSTQVDADVRDRIEATIKGLRAVATNMTMAQFTTDGLDAWCQRMEDDYNDGARWPITHGVGLTPGRPLGD